jgi:hypothetical protein
VGTLLGGAIWAATVVLLAKGGDHIGPKLSLLSQFYPGYSVTWTGSVIGFLYGLGTGFLFGFSFACSRNIAMRLHLGSQKVQRFLNRVHQSQVSVKP